MPGIAGIIGPGAPGERKAAAGVMVQSMMGEPFCASGTFAEPRLGVWAGWVCHRDSFSDCLPVWNEERTVALLFSGEDFTDATDIARLKERGHRFSGQNGEYLVHLYEEFGAGFLERLNGGFSGMLVDLRENRVLLFNDRYGLNRVYFHEAKSGFYFSSEAKSLLKTLPELRELDRRGLGEFLSCGCVLQNRTLFSRISLLPPASVWSFRPGRPIDKQIYFKVEDWEQQPALGAEDYYEQLKETWRRVLPRYFRGSTPVGLSLTGGVDSRMILAWAPREAGTLPCYTFGGNYRDCADVEISREIARITRQRHEVISVGREFLDQFPSLAERSVYLSDGTMGVLGSIDLYIQEKARRIAPVRVTGTNGGEILRRLVAFNPSALQGNLLDGDMAGWVQRAEDTYAQELKGHRLSFTAFKQAPWYMSSKFVLERSQLTLRMPYFDNDLVSLVYRTPAELADTNDVSLRLIADGNAALGRVRTDRGGGAESTAGLAKAAHLFREFTFKAEYAYDSGMPQWLATVDHALAPLRLERLFLGRHKFHHFRVWYRDELSGYVKEVLLDPRTRNRPYLQGAGLEPMVNHHLKGDRNFTMQIHQLLTCELIQRTLIENGAMN